MDFNQLIKKQRLLLGKTLDEVALATGVSKATVQRWESGAIQNLRRDKIANLANALETSPEYLMGWETPIKSNISDIKTDNIRMFPVYNSVSAGFGTYADNNIVDYVPLFIKNNYEADNTIIVTVKGDSMSPKIDDGDCIQVLKQTSVDSGSVAVVLLDGEEALVKKVNYGDDWIELVSYNPYYPPMRFEKEEVLRLQVLGLVKKIIKEL